MTGKDHDSLGRAIQDLRPGTSTTSVKAATKTAEKEANDDLNLTKTTTPKPSKPGKDHDDQ